jgi:hypothetical protein
MECFAHQRLDSMMQRDWSLIEPGSSLRRIGLIIDQVVYPERALFFSKAFPVQSITSQYSAPSFDVYMFERGLTAGEKLLVVVRRILTAARLTQRL